MTANEALELKPQEEEQLLTEANLGSIDAAIKLAKFFSYVKLDFRKAVFWYRKAALSGHVVSQFNLGCTLIFSLGDEESVKEGIYWLELAEKNGEPTARGALDEYKKSLLKK